MKNKTLVDPNDFELGLAFAEVVCGTPWRKVHPKTASAFVRSADAVLPWLEKELLWTVQGVGMESKPGAQYIIEVLVEGTPRYYVQARDNAFPKAAVIALLRAKGIEVEFKKAASASLSVAG